MRHILITCISLLSQNAEPVQYNKNRIEAKLTNEASVTGYHRT